MPSINRIASVPSAIYLETLPLVLSPAPGVIFVSALRADCHVARRRQPPSEKLSDYLRRERPQDHTVHDDVDRAQFFAETGYVQRALVARNPVVDDNLTVIRDVF